jgi:hypothetical protein
LICAVMKPISPAPSSAAARSWGGSADAVDQVGGAGLHELDLLALADRAVDDADEDDDAEIGIVPAVDEHRLQRRGGIALRRRDAVTIASSTSSMPMPVLAEVEHRIVGGKADDILDLLLHLVDSAAGRSILLITGTISWSCSIDW